MARNTAFFMHQRAVQIVQQQRAAGGASPPAPPFSFTDPSFGGSSFTRVYAIIDDGSGGKFVGGDFTSVTCNVTSTTYTTGYERLVHLLPNGEVDSSWSCPVGSSTVYALALDVANDRLFVGGNFSSIGGELRSDLAMVEASSGDVDTEWTCDVSGDVRALALDVANNRLFVGGSYSSIGGESRSRLAMVEASSGDVDTEWVCNTNNYRVVHALALDVANDRLFVGGYFSSIGGESRTNLAMVEASSGTVDLLWVCDATSGYVYALALDVANDRLFVGGGFLGIGGELRDDLAMVDASSGTVDTEWVCNLASGNLYALALDVPHNRLFVGGSFSGIGGESRTGLAMVEASSGTVDTEWTCDGLSIHTLLSDPANDALFVGGYFNGPTGLDGQQRDRFGTVVASTGDLHVP